MHSCQRTPIKPVREISGWCRVQRKYMPHPNGTEGVQTETENFNFRFGNDVYFPLGTKSVDITHRLESVRINLDYFVLN